MTPSHLQSPLVSIMVGIATCFIASSGCSKPTDSIDPMRVFQDQQIRVGIPANSAIKTAFEEIQSEWEFQTGAKVELIEHLSEQIQSSPTQTFAGDDILIFPSWALGDLAENDSLHRLEQTFLEDENLNWNDFFPVLKNYFSRWSRATLSIPLGTPTLVCYFRRDLLEQYGHSPPHDWESYFRVAQSITRTSAASDNSQSKPQLGLAEPLGKEWRRFVFLARAATYSKHPNNYSFLFDLRSMKPLIAEDGFILALEDMVTARDLSPLASSDQQRIDTWIKNENRNSYGDDADRIYEGGSPLFDEKSGDTRNRYDYILEKHPELQANLNYNVSDVQHALRTGQAMLGLGWEYPNRRQSTGTDHIAAIGITSLPGSNRVFDTTRKQWENMDKNPNQPAFLGFMSLSLSLSKSTDNLDVATHFTRYFFEYLSNNWPPEQGDPSVVPFRNTHQGNIMAWVHDDLGNQEAQQFFTIQQSATSSDNFVFDLRIPGSQQYMTALDQALHEALNGISKPRKALETVAEKWESITDTYDRTKQRENYRKSLPIP
ncbi:MAG: extracellular solute-binding protein [Planctomycetes bacterium]|nr:extracellular solute-binding protein [Planctomycetota bacterium]